MLLEHQGEDIRRIFTRRENHSKFILIFVGHTAEWEKVGPTFSSCSYPFLTHPSMAKDTHTPGSSIGI